MRKILVLLLLAAPLILSCTSSTASRKEAQEAKGVQEYAMGVDVKVFEKDYAKVHGNELKKMEEMGNPGEFLLEDGKAMFHKVDGSAGGVRMAVGGGAGVSVGIGVAVGWDAARAVSYAWV